MNRGWEPGDIAADGGYEWMIFIGLIIAVGFGSTWYNDWKYKRTGEGE